VHIIFTFDVIIKKIFAFYRRTALSISGAVEFLMLLALRSEISKVLLNVFFFIVNCFSIKLKKLTVRYAKKFLKNAEYNVTFVQF
jgi:hypothetical protein